MKTWKDIVSALPETDRDKAREIMEAELSAAGEAGFGRAQHDIREAKRVAKRADELEAKVTDLTAQLSASGDAGKRIAELDKAVKDLTSERDSLAPYRAEFESAKLRELTAAAFRDLAQPELLDHVMGRVKPKLVTEEKDGARTYRLNLTEADVKAFREDAANARLFAQPETSVFARRPIEQTSGRPHTNRSNNDDLLRLPDAARARAEQRLKDAGLA